LLLGETINHVGAAAMRRTLEEAGIAERKGKALAIFAPQDSAKVNEVCRQIR
jgi:hypothetical protein